MSAEAHDDETGDKPHEATPRKLEEARRKGELPQSADLAATAAMIGFLALTLWPGAGAAGVIGQLGRALLERAVALSDLLRGGGAVLGSLVLGPLAAGLAPLALVPGAAVLAALLALRGLVFAPARLAPRLSRLSPLANARQKFGPSGLFAFAKSAVKLVVYGAVLTAYLARRLPELMTAVAQEPGQVTALMMRLTVEFLVIVAVIMALAGAVDYLFQRHDHLRRQRMSHRELRDEIKSAEGDPALKQARRSRAEAIASNRMLAEVPKATVVIVNPTHYAVALRWSPGTAGAPVCVAKGTDEIAARIREIAEAAGVPIHHDPPTARALHATVRLGAEVQPEHFAPVAAAIRFAEAMRQRARGRVGR